MSGWNARISLRNLRHSPRTTQGDVREATVKVLQVIPETSRDATCLVTWIIEALELGRGVTARTRSGASSTLASIVPHLTVQASRVPAIVLGPITCRLVAKCCS